MDTFHFMVHLPSSKCVHQCACVFARGVYMHGMEVHVMCYTIHPLFHMLAQLHVLATLA